MNIRIVPYTEHEVAAARAFNERLRKHNETEFTVPNQAPKPQPEETAIYERNFLALEGDVVRGGFLLARYRGTLEGGSKIDVINCREPLSEGIIDSKYSLLAVRLLKRMQEEGPYLFALGMGSEEARFPRLLRSAGWTIQPVPFFFKVIRARNFLRHIKMLRTSPARRTVAAVAANTGVGALGISVLQFRSVFHKKSSLRLRLEPATRWDTWANDLWEQFRPCCSFAVTRDVATLELMYPIRADARLSVYRVKNDSTDVAWVATRNTKMRNHKYFGDMQVGTILDCVAPPAAMRAVISLATRELARAGADLIVSNQSNRMLVDAFYQAGFLGLRSNYILALSKSFAKILANYPSGLARLHFTRGDGDGRDHL